MDKTVHAVWERAGGRRRLLLLALIIVPSLLAARTMYSLLPHKGASGSDCCYLYNEKQHLSTV